MGTKARSALFASAVLVAVLALAAPAYAAKDAYEPDNSLKKAHTIGLSTDVKSTTMQMHTFHSNTDVDYVKFSTKKGTTYDLKVIGTNIKSKKRWLKLTIYRYSASKNKWYQPYYEISTDGAANKHFPFKASATTKYAVRLRPYGKSGSGVSYGLRVITNKYPAIKTDNYESADNTRTSATPLLAQPSWNATSYANNGVYRYQTLYSACQLHSISTTSDIDWYSITMPAGHSYYIVLDMGDRTNQTVNLDFTDSSGNPLPTLHWTTTHEFGYAGWLSMPSTYTYFFRVTGNGKAKFWYRIGLFSTP